MKKVFAILLVLVMVLMLLPAPAVRAEGRTRPGCGEALTVDWIDNTYHGYACYNHSSKYFYYDYNCFVYEEKHSPDGNCQCSVCGTYNHHITLFSDGVHTEPTCTEPGVDIDGACYYCEGCHLYFRLAYTDRPPEPIGTFTPAQGHDIIPRPAQAPTCTEVGWEDYTGCTRCDYKENYKEIPRLGPQLGMGYGQGAHLYRGRPKA